MAGIGMAMLFAAGGCGQTQKGGAATGTVPANVQAIFEKPFYKGATWGLRVVDLDTNKVLLDFGGDHKYFIGSVRKVFTVGELMDEIGPTHRFDTPIYRRGTLDKSGVLHGDLILVASGDLTMGGRTNPDGTVAYTSLDHNEANTLGTAFITKPDPLAGYKSLAQQVKAAGIKKVTGQVIVDDRLFKPFPFRNEFDVRPIFVNDDAVDLIINPTTAGKLVSMEHRPVSKAFAVQNALMMTPAGKDAFIDLTPVNPPCIGKPNCSGKVSGTLPVGYLPPITHELPQIRMFRIVQPANYARTVLIESLQAAGVTVAAPAVAENPVNALPAAGEYAADTRVALLQGMPYSEDAKLVMKVSYNIGAETSLMLLGLAKGVDNMPAALDLEKKNLAQKYGIAESEFHFVDGSGGGDSAATNAAVTKMLTDLYHSKVFPDFDAALPVMGEDGSLAMVTDFKSNPELAGAFKKIRAKPGTYVTATSPSDIYVRGQAFGGFIDTKSGKHLVYQLVVNDVKINGIEDVVRIFQDEGTISAILWRDQ